MAYELNPEYVGIYCSGESFTDAVGKAAVLNSFSLWQIAGFTGPFANVAQGVICSNNVSRKTARVQVSGITKVRLGADVNAGDRLGFDINGDMIPDPAGTIGWATESGKAGSLTSALLNIIVPGAGGADGVITGGSVVGTDLVITRSVGGDITIDLSPLPGGGTVAEQLCKNYVAGETLSALKLVYIDPTDGRVYNADHTDLTTACSVVGFTKTAAATAGTAVQVISEGMITDASLSYNTALDPTLFLALTGNVTQAPVTSGYLLQAGFVTGTDSMYVDIQPPIILA